VGPLLENTSGLAKRFPETARRRGGDFVRSKGYMTFVTFEPLPELHENQEE
jgi:hypothetical protein